MYSFNTLIIKNKDKLNDLTLEKVCQNETKESRKQKNKDKRLK